NMIISTVGNTIGRFLPEENTNMIYHLYQSSHFTLAILGSIVLLVILFIATKYILDRNLNLE
ncbi:ABC transporter permease, partial [Clostridioides difficile]